MKLPELFELPDAVNPQFKPFLRNTLRPGMPPLKLDKLALETIVAHRERVDEVVTGSLLLTYKDKAGALTSLNEEGDGEVWDISQVQGARSKVAYRLTSGLHWQRMLGHLIHDFSRHPEAEVRRITMASIDAIKNIDGAESNSVDHTYIAVRKVLGMRFSEEAKCYVVDIE